MYQMYTHSKCTIQKKKVYNSMVCAVITKVCSHHHKQFENIFITQKQSSHFAFPSILPSNYSSHSVNLLSVYRDAYSDISINGLIKYVVSCTLFSSSHNALKVHHAVACISTSFLLLLK